MAPPLSSRGVRSRLLILRRERVKEWSGLVAAAGVASGLAGPGSDFSEVSTLGLESAALESVAAPSVLPGPSLRVGGVGRFRSLTSWR